jgi:hypothetical protein
MRRRLSTTTYHYSTTMQGTNPPPQQSIPIRDIIKLRPRPPLVRESVLRQVCSPHTYLTDGNPPRSSRGQTKVSTSNSGTCLDSALAHPHLHWTLDQLSAPRNKRKVLSGPHRVPSKTPHSTSQDCSGWVEPVVGRGTTSFGHSCSTDSTVSTPLGVSLAANHRRGLVLSQNGREVDPCIQ